MGLNADTEFTEFAEFAELMGRKFVSFVKFVSKKPWYINLICR